MEQHHPQLKCRMASNSIAWRYGALQIPDGVIAPAIGSIANRYFRVFDDPCSLLGRLRSSEDRTMGATVTIQAPIPAASFDPGRGCGLTAREVVAQITG